MSIPSDYADRIRHLRAYLGLSQRKLAEQLGVSFVTVNRWENLQSRPTRLAWLQIERAERLGLEGLRKRKGAEQTALLGAARPGHFVVAERGPHYGQAAGKSDVQAQRPLDFGASAPAVRAVVEAHRLGYGHLFNPGFASEISLIDPLPHQRIAVYQHMLTQPRLRFLLADDAGAGKTIMAGLYIREMLSRKLIRRILIVPPAGLVGNWEREMKTLFSLNFRAISGSDSNVGNPFADEGSDRVIVSVDTLCGRKTFERLRDPSTSPYDLVIFDEAHKLSADRNPDFTMRKTDRYRLAEAIAGASTDPEWILSWSSFHLLLMTATPHMGKDYPYFCLWRLLEPEELTTPDAFNAYPAEERKRHFLRRTKEEMVRFDGSRIFPARESRTLSYSLTQKEQELYDKTTSYIRTFYNRAQVLNRSAVRLAMSVFQRRLASSTYALLRSLERRRDKLDGLIEDIVAGRMSMQDFLARQRTLDDARDTFETSTADEEDAREGREQNELAEDTALSGVIARTLGELQAERLMVAGLVDLAREALAAGEGSKFRRLREVLQDPQFKDEKVLIFTEHRDTQHYIVRELEALGYAERIAVIHGGMDYDEREKQIAFFKRRSDEAGASCMVATDAAGEGINLQFCWIMVNYDIPWNPARLEQRMGRIHRYKQTHDVLLLNLVAPDTREGRVLKTLLDKLQLIRKELTSDKVFDIIGLQLQGVSIRDLILQAVVDGKEAEAIERIEGILTSDQVRARDAQMETLLGTAGDVLPEVPAEREKMEREDLLRLVPGYVRHFLEESAPLLGIGLEGDLDGHFRLTPERAGALNPLLPYLEEYQAGSGVRLMLHRPAEGDVSVYFRPGEPLFDRYRSLVAERLGQEALRGAVFVDPYAERAYLFHLMLVRVRRSGAAHGTRGGPVEQDDTLEVKLVGLRQEESGEITECPVEHLMFLRGGGTVPMAHVALAVAGQTYRDKAKAFTLASIANPLAESHASRLAAGMETRSAFVARGYDYQAAELLRARARLKEMAESGDPRAAAEMEKVKERQREIGDLKMRALAALRGEPDLVAADEPRFLAHALVIPSSDPEERMRHDAEIERAAVRIAWEYENGRGSAVKDVSSPEGAMWAGLEARPGFDLLSHHPSGETRAIEVKGRAGIGDVELTENEWAKACNARSQYWLYVVYGCATARPRLVRVQDPFGKLFVRNVGGVVIGENEVLMAAEKEGPYDQG
jgi:superfamily II DNA or RNA helicase